MLELQRGEKGRLRMSEIEHPPGMRERMLIDSVADRMAPVGMPTPENDRGRPRTLRLLPDMSMLVWHHAPVEARGGLVSSEGKPIMKLGLVMDWLSADEAFDFFHRQALTHANFLTKRDNAIKDARKRGKKRGKRK